MNQIEKRLGLLIKIKRRKKLKSGDLSFKQDYFIRSNQNYRFEGIECGFNVCSLATLSRIENGKHKHDFALIDFFLKKLDINYRIKESILDKENELLSFFMFNLKHNPTHLDSIFDTLDLFYNDHLNDDLLVLDKKAIDFIRCVLQHKPKQRKTFDYLYEMKGVYHPIIEDCLIGCGLWLKLIHPDFWDIHLIEHGSEHLFEFKHHKVNQKIVYLYPLNRPRITPYSVSKRTTYFINAMIQISQAKKEPVNETELCLGLIHGHPLPHKGSSKLFKALSTYKELEKSNYQLEYVSGTIFSLLRHEPLHKVITRHLCPELVILCQNTKTYKPLITLVELLSENQINSTILTYD